MSEKELTLLWSMLGPLIVGTLIFDTMARLGIWDHNVRNYGGPESTLRNHGLLLKGLVGGSIKEPRYHPRCIVGCCKFKGINYIRTA